MRERDLKFGISLWHIDKHGVLLTAARERERERDRQREGGGRRDDIHTWQGLW